ncbi:ArnT family glycosyltransferase [Candidatus Omnitrophota bacterium]
MSNKNLDRLKHYLPSIIILLIVASSLVYLLCVSWLRWGHIFNDTPHELSFPQQILEGKVLYGDLFHVHGLFSPYLIAFLYKIFGVQILTLVWLGIALTSILSLVLYKLSRLFLDRFPAALVVVTFLYLFAFGFYMPSSGIFNFILPYSFSSTFFVLFTSCALYFFIRFVLFEKRSGIVLWATSLSLAFLCRPTLTLLVWIGFLLSGVVLLLKNKPSRAYWPYLLIPLAAGVGIYALFVIRFDAFSGFKESVLMSSLYILGGNAELSTESGLMQSSSTSTQLFLKHLTDITRQKGLVILLSFLAHLAVISLAAIGSQGISWSFAKKRKKLLSLLTFLAGSLLIAAVFFTLYHFLTTHFPLQSAKSFPKIRTYPQFMCLMIIFLTMIPALFIKSVVSSKDKKSIALLTLFLVSFLPTLRMPFSAHPHGAGFYLYVLAMLCYYVFFFTLVGDFLQRYLKGLVKPLFYSIMICVFLLPVVHLWQFSKTAYAGRTAEIKTDFGTFFYADTPERLKFIATIDYLKNHTSPDDTVVAYPDALSINFFSQRKNPTRYYVLDYAVYNEDTIISHLAEADVDYFVVIMNKPGLSKRKVYTWILQHYRCIKVIGPLEQLPPLIGIFKKKKLLKP